MNSCWRVLLVGLAVAAFPALTGSASAATPASAWTVDSVAAPSNFSTTQNATCQAAPAELVGQCDAYQVNVVDAGSEPSDGSPIIISDTLPAGLTVQRVSFFWSALEGADLGELLCTTTPLQCRLPAAEFGLPPVAPDDALQMIVYVTVDEPVVSSSLVNAVSVSGGGVPDASSSAENQIDDASPPFGFSAFSAFSAGLDGISSTQAGDHPYELTTVVDPSSVISTQFLEGQPLPTSVEDLKDVVVDLPLGYVGSSLAAPECTLHHLSSRQCPDDTKVGHLLTEPRGGVSINSPIWNLVPERGVPAEFGYLDINNNSHILYPSVVPTAAGYVLRVTSPDIPQVDLNHIVVNFYGDPAARDAARDPEAEDVPFFTNPAECDGRPLVTHAYMDSWQHPCTYNPDGSPNLDDPDWAITSSEAPPVSGCNQLAGLFHPTIEAHPETTQADSPTGLDVNIKVPQSEGVQTLGTPPLRKAVVTLPAGMSVNPSSANGLQGCSLAQVGVSAAGQPDGEAPHCPDASKIGTVELETPALPGVLEGQIYVAKQTENPFHKLLALYIVVNDPKTGVIVKLPGEISADATTGQLTTIVDNSPQFPFSELRTHFFGGQRAALRTPALCGTYKVTSQLTPWSAPESGPPATPSASFKISSAPGGGPCPTIPAAQPNKPAFSAGTLTPIAGAFSPFSLRLAREDGSQELKGLNVTLPPGLVGKLAGVAECSDGALATAAEKSGAAEQASPSCSASSQVGTVTVGAGAGLTPYYAAGHVYLAGPYKGAPLSLAVITPATAGPYDLGTVVVRNALQVNTETARITAVSDPIPAILQGIPLDVRSIAIDMSRPDFTLNPTSCEKMAVAGEALSVLNQIAPLSNPFQVGECKKLGFAPKLALDLKGSTKRGGTPAFKATLSYPKGSYANIASASVALPHSEFLDNAHIKTVCTRVQLAANQCPKGSIYGYARAIIPLLDKPLEGPVYLGTGYGHELPDLLADLNGQIHVVLNGTIDSIHGGIRNRFEVVPDAPVSKFTLEMRGGKKGLLENSENLCRKTQHATAKFTAQNGKTANYSPVLTNDCKGSGAKGKKKHRHGKG